MDRLLSQGKSCRQIFYIEFQNTFYVGSYLGYGFHEDGIQSSLKVCKKLNIEIKNFTNADTSRIPWN